MIDAGYYRLKKRLARHEFNEPLLEDYRELGHHFFGFYAQVENMQAKTEAHFRDQAVDFFIDVDRALPNARPADTRNKVYPRCENRKWVNGHLARERSQFLATQCKERDKFCCRVCEMTFTEMYGKALGGRFAEAHHKNPLGTLDNKVKTQLHELVTVCANCHRMLHRMDGKAGDIAKLKAIVRRHRT